jgi:3',5'-cyclic AMP phosphodiesterase CpdA
MNSAHIKHSMVKYSKPLFIACLAFMLFACQQNHAKQPNNLQIAFLADVHLQDIYGQLQDTEHKGVKNPANGQFVLARTMEAQLRSTRLFNENYFALLAALDDIASRGVKFVVLPGDFSDDGQPLNVRGLKNILNEYSQKHGITFLATTGNHDPVRPFTMDAGKSDFLGMNGQSQALMSKEGIYISKSNDDLPVIITNDICKLGYREIITEMADFGFSPKKSDIYWETPYTTYNFDNYSYAKAIDQSGIDHRTYQLANVAIPDVSYLVEPISNVWFLAIDANVYLPNNNAASDPKNPSNFGNAGDGYSKVLSDKAHLVNWVKKITTEAKKRGKTLIVFSHYPWLNLLMGHLKTLRN